MNTAKFEHVESRTHEVAETLYPIYECRVDPGPLPVNTRNSAAVARLLERIHGDCVTAWCRPKQRPARPSTRWSRRYRSGAVRFPPPRSKRLSQPSTRHAPR